MAVLNRFLWNDGELPPQLVQPHRLCVYAINGDLALFPLNDAEKALEEGALACARAALRDAVGRAGRQSVSKERVQKHGNVRNGEKERLQRGKKSRWAGGARRSKAEQQQHPPTMPIFSPPFVEKLRSVRT